MKGQFLSFLRIFGAIEIKVDYLKGILGGSCTESVSRILKKVHSCNERTPDMETSQSRDTKCVWYQFNLWEEVIWITLAATNCNS